MPASALTRSSPSAAGSKVSSFGTPRASDAATTYCRLNFAASMLAGYCAPARLAAYFEMPALIAAMSATFAPSSSRIASAASMPVWMTPPHG